MQQVLNLLKKYGQTLRNASFTKYFLVLALAVVWMVFFDRYNLISRQKVADQIETLKADKAHYEQALINLESQKRGMTEAEEVERIAREKYHMKRANEEVFVVN
ncbi:MAG: cell division protein FtsL [Bacteroidota bacterium]